MVVKANTTTLRCIICILAVLRAAAVSPCCGPKQWHGSILKTLGEYNRDLDVGSLAYANTKIYYDYVNKQIAVKEERQNMTVGYISNKWTIMKFKLGNQYVIESGVCTEYNLGNIMPSPCIPDTATFMGTKMYPGVGVNIWFFKAPGNFHTTRISVTEDTCWPVSETILSSGIDGQDYVLSMNMYQNITLGPGDPSVFVVPSSCPHETSSGFSKPSGKDSQFRFMSLKDILDN